MKTTAFSVLALAVGAFAQYPTGYPESSTTASVKPTTSSSAAYVYPTSAVATSSVKPTTSSVWVYPTSAASSSVYVTSSAKPVPSSTTDCDDEETAYPTSKAHPTSYPAESSKAYPTSYSASAIVYPTKSVPGTVGTVTSYPTATTSKAVVTAGANANIVRAGGALAAAAFAAIMI